MSLFEDVMALAVQMPQAERERLAQALGAAGAGRASQSLPLQQFVPRPDPVAWRKAETGHAVLNTATGQDAVEFPEGPAEFLLNLVHHVEESPPLHVDLTDA